MATTKNTLASASYIQQTSSTTVTYTPVGEAIVSDGRLVPSYKVFTPGIYSPGTTNEQSVSNAQQP